MKAPTDIPAFYDDLDAVREKAWRMMEEGVSDARGAFHTPVLATTAGDGPHVRTVVLRSVNRTDGTFRFHTDRRSRKAAQLGANAAVSLLFYDAAAKVQLRVEGRATLHDDDGVADAAWQAARAMSRVCYTIDPPPGTPIESGGGYETVSDEAASEWGRENFAAVVVKASALDWLYLNHHGHRRARFDLAAGTATWLAP